MVRIRPIQWFKAHPYVADAHLAVALAGMQVATHIWSHDTSYPRSHASIIGALLSALIAVPLVWRRRAPLHVLVVTTALLGLAEFSLTNTGGFLSTMVAIYSVGAHCRGRPRSIAMAGFAVFFAIGWIVSWRQHTFQISSVLSAIISFTIAYVIGDNLQRRRQAVADLAERAERAELERELLAREQVRDERTRIARELHDVIAHSLSVMVIQAAAARRQLPTDPQKATEALAAVESTGREAMDEMRRVLGVLRSDRDPGDNSLAPQPSLGDLPELIAASPDVPVHLHTEGSFDGLTPGVELSAFRVVQEAITNVRRHAGTVSSVDVWLRCHDGNLTVEVSDDGRRVWPVATPELRARGFVTVEMREDATRSWTDRLRRSGFGLIGMRERVSAFGGELWAGPRPEGGWSVRAEFPAAAR
jgi:signal transduction histidine kinase